MSASEDTIQNSIAALVDRFQTPVFAELLQICDDSKRLMMGLYFVEKGCFLHCNRPLQNFLGDYGKEFMSRGLGILAYQSAASRQSLSPEQDQFVFPVTL